MISSRDFEFRRDVAGGAGPEVDAFVGLLPMPPVVVLTAGPLPEGPPVVLLPVGPLFEPAGGAAAAAAGPLPLPPFPPEPPAPAAGLRLKAEPPVEAGVLASAGFAPSEKAGVDPEAAVVVVEAASSFFWPPKLPNRPPAGAAGEAGFAASSFFAPRPPNRLPEAGAVGLAASSLFPAGEKSDGEEAGLSASLFRLPNMFPAGAAGLLAASSFLAPNKPPVGAAVEAGATGAAAPKSEGADGVVAEAGACDVFPPSEKAGFEALPPSEKADWPAGADCGVEEAPPRLNMGLLAGAAPSAGFWPNMEVGGAEAEVLSSGFLPNEAKALFAGAAPPRGAPNVAGAVLGASAALSSGLPKRGFAPLPPPKRPPVD